MKEHSTQMEFQGKIYEKSDDKNSNNNSNRATEAK